MLQLQLQITVARSLNYKFLFRLSVEATFIGYARYTLLTLQVLAVLLSAVLVEWMGISYAGKHNMNSELYGSFFWKTVNANSCSLTVLNYSLLLRLQLLTLTAVP